MRVAAGDATKRLSAADKAAPVPTDEVSFISMNQKLALGDASTAGIGPSGAANLAFRLPALEKSAAVMVNIKEPGLPGAVLDDQVLQSRYAAHSCILALVLALTFSILLIHSCTYSCTHSWSHSSSHSSSHSWSHPFTAIVCVCWNDRARVTRAQMASSGKGRRP